MTDGAPRAGLVTSVDGLEHLVGSTCSNCATVAFPVVAACARCGQPTVETALPRRGTVWSWTVQRIRPKPPYRGPAPFEPFTVAYVDLGALKVESPLTGREVDGWVIGDPVELVIVPAGDDRDVTFAFAPAGSS